METSKYLSIQKIAESGNAVIYRAVRKHDDVLTVLKIPRTEYPSEAEVARYQHEYDMLSRIDSDAVIRAYGLTRYGNRPVLELEDFDAQSLKEWMGIAPFDLAERLHMAVRMCACVEEVHRHQLVHRDINPSNFLVRARDRTVKLSDFAMSSPFVRERQRAIQVAELEGTLAYVSPEQTGRTNRHVDYRSDIYSLGATLYELLSGEPPFQSDDTLAVVHAHIAQAPTPLDQARTDIPEILSDVVLKCLAKNAEDRYQSAYGLQRDLERCIQMVEGPGGVQPFALAENDHSREFNVSQKLYGRRAEWDVLQKGYQRARYGTTEAVLFAGVEGSGKSALLLEAVDAWQEKTRWLGRGICSSFDQGAPYAGLSQALGHMMSAVLELPNEGLQAWKKKVLTPLGANAGLLVGLVPHVEDLLGSTVSVPDHASPAAKVILWQTLQQFLTALADDSPPLVLCIDDLQCADEDTLGLLQHVLHVEPVPWLMVVGSYLEHGALADRLLSFVETVRDAGGVSVTEQALSALTVADVSDLLMDSFRLATDDATKFAALLIEKTRGNPFFIHQMLTEFHRNGWLAWNEPDARWVWDEGQIERAEGAVNVVDFLIQRLDMLSPQARELLAQAACIGDWFSPALLAKVRDEGEDAVYQTLEELTQDRFIERIRAGAAMSAGGSAAPDQATESVCQFAHARIRQAAYQQMEPHDRERLHMHIVELLYTEWTDKEREQHSYELAEHFLAARKLLNPKQAVWGAETCLLAGRQAMAAVSFETAYRFLEAGADLLPEDAWESHYPLAHALFQELIVTDFACGQYEKALELAKHVRDHANSIADRVHAIGFEMNVYTIQSRATENYQTGMEALLLCGIEIPKKITRRAVHRQWQVVKDLIGDRTPQEIAALPELADPICAGAMRMLVVTSNFQNAVSVAFLHLKIAELSLRHGHTATSSSGFTALCSIMNIYRPLEVEEAYDFAQIGAALTDRFRDPRATANFIGTFGFSLNHWHNHLKTTVAYADQHYEITRSLGRVGFAVLSSFRSVYARFVCGERLSGIQEQAVEFVDLSCQYSLPFTEALLRLLLDALTALQSDLDALPIRERSVSDEMADVDLQFYSRCLNCMLLYLADQPMEALPLVSQIEQWITRTDTEPDFMAPETVFYNGLVLAALYPGLDAQDEAGYRRGLGRLMRLMHAWAKGCPDNYLHKALLLQAEYKRLVGSPHEAADLYDEAIASARQYGFVQNRAVANECAAKFYLVQNKQRVAAAYLEEARYLYRQWGALGKVRQLEEKYAHLLNLTPARDAESRSAGLSSAGSASIPSGTSIVESLDIATLLRTSQAISREIELDKLLSTMLTLVIQSAGAQRGCWILPENDEWLVLASTEVNRPEQPGASMPIQESDKVSFRIVQYAIRTQKVIVLDNASEEGRFVRDPHVRRTKAKSVLCFPVVKQSQVVAVLYAENNLGTHTFTPQRVELLRLLSGQAAISIENARMYERLDQLVQVRTEQLQRTQEQMVQSEKMASLGQLTAGVAHEINNPINFVVSSIAPLRRDVEDMMDVLNKCRAIIQERNVPQDIARARAIEEEMDFAYTTEEITTLLQSIEEGGKRTAEIVKDLRTFSRLDEDEVKKASITEGIESTLALLRRQAESRVTIVRDYKDQPEIECFPGKLNQVYMNLLSNAIQAIEGEGEIRISVEQIEDAVQIRIADTGAGMSEAVKNRIFEPFFTTKEVGAGTGLGLSISYGIIERHHGSISVDSEPGRGTTFTLTMPMKQSAG